MLKRLQTDGLQLVYLGGWGSAAPMFHRFQAGLQSELKALVNSAQLPDSITTNTLNTQAILMHPETLRNILIQSLQPTILIAHSLGGLLAVSEYLSLTKAKLPPVFWVFVSATLGLCSNGNGFQERVSPVAIKAMKRQVSQHRDRLEDRFIVDSLGEVSKQNNIDSALKNAMKQDFSTWNQEALECGLDVLMNADLTAGFASLRTSNLKGGLGHNGMVIHGEHDRVIPFSHGENLAKSLGLPLSILHLATHALFYTHPDPLLQALLPALKTWLQGDLTAIQDKEGI